MTELSMYGGAGLTPIDGRRASRTISKHRAAGQVQLGKADVVVDVAIGKAEGLTAATGSAMQSVIRVSQLQRSLEQLAPEASGRLAMLADDHALNMVDVISGLRRDLR